MRQSWPIALILFSSFLLNVLPLWWGLPSILGWAHDELIPGEVRESYRWPHKYPPFHRYLLAAIYYPILQQKGYLGLDPFELDTLLFFVGRSLSVLLATSTVYVVYRCGRELGGRLASYCAASVAALMPPFVYYAKTVNLEAPYVFWFALSVLFFLRILRRHRPRDYILFGALAALAICTKDQAYGLYLLSPIPMVLSLALAAGGGASAYVAALFDRRMVAMGLTAVGLFVLIHQIPWSPETFERHVKTMVGPASADYRIYPATLAGHWQMGLQSFKHVAFTMGVPFFLAALGGLALAVRRRHWKLLALGVFAISYYLTFISVIGYNYVRFFIPVCLLLALPAGGVLAELLRERGRASALRRALVGAALLYVFLRAASVDVWMIQDVRYDVERWLEARTDEAALGIGVRRDLPRRVEILEWRRLSQYECVVLDKLDAKYVVLNPQTANNRRTFTRFMAGELGYATAARFRRPEGPFLSVSGLISNLDKIARDMVILERTGEDCMDLAGVIRELNQLKRANDAEQRARLLAIIRHQDVAAKFRLGEDEGDDSMIAVGLAPDRWTYGVRPAAIAVRNRSSRERAPRLTLLAGRRDGDLPLTVWVDDGGEAHRYVFDQPRGGDVELPAVPADSERLFIIWADKEWRDASRRLGVRIRSAEWAEGG